MENLNNSFRHGCIQLAGSVTWKALGNTLFFYSDNVLKLEELPPDIIRCIPLLEQGIDYEILVQEVRDIEMLDELLNILVGLQYVIKAQSDAWHNTRVEKQVSYFSSLGLDGDAVQSRLDQAHVVILGLGGIGSVVLQNLVAAGIHRYILIDHDRVQVSNLNRQFIFRPDQLGELKVSAARNYILNHDQDAVVYEYSQFVHCVEDLVQLPMAESADCFILAADHPVGKIQRITAEFCLKYAIPFMVGGCGLNTAVWGPLVTPADCQSYIDHISQQLDFSYPDRIMNASFGPTNTILGALMAHDVLLFLAGLQPKSHNRLLTIDFRSMAIRNTLLNDSMKGRENRLESQDE